MSQLPMTHLKSARSHVQGHWCFKCMSRPKMSLAPYRGQNLFIMCVARSFRNVPNLKIFAI